MADGSIIIDTKINTETASSQLLQLENKIRKTSNEINALSKKMQDMKDAKVPTKEYEEISTQIREAESEFDKLLAKQEEMQNAGKTSGSAWNTLQYKMEEIGNTIMYAKGELQDLIDKGQAFALGSNTQEYKDLGQKLQDANANMQVLCRRHEELREKQEKNVKGYSSMQKSAQKSTSKIGAFLKNLASKFNIFNKSTKTGNGLLHTMGTRLRGLSLSLLVFNWISKGFNAMISGMKEGIQNLAKHSSAFNRTMSDLKSSTEQAKNALATAFAPVISAIIPYITSFVNALSYACNEISRFYALITGKSTYTKAKKQNADYASSLDGIANSAKKALGALAAFDELNVLSQNDDSASGGGTGGTGGDMFEEVPIGDISDWMKRLKEAIENGDWFGLGRLISQKLTDAMNSINWEKVYEGARNFGKGLALFLNGLITPELFGALGRTIAGALNTALYSAFSFSENFSFENAGISFSALLNEFFSTFDFEISGKTVSNFARGILKFLTTAIKYTEWKKVGEDIATYIANINWIGIIGDLAVLLVEALKAGLDLATGFYNKLYEEFQDVDWDSLGKEIIDFICNIDWGGLLKSLGEFLVSVFMANIELKKGIGKLFESLQEELRERLSKFWDEEIAPQFSEDKWKELGECIKSGISQKWNEFLQWWNGTAIVNWWTNDVKPWFKKDTWLELGGNIKAAIIEKWNETKEEWRTSISDWWTEHVEPWFSEDQWEEVGTNMKEGIYSGFKGIVNQIVDILNSVLSSVESFINNNIFDGLNSLLEEVNKSAVGEYFDLDLSLGKVSFGRVPKLAEGSVIRGGSPFLAVLGDQPSGQTNIETPLSTMVDAFKQAYREVGADAGGEYTFIAKLNERTIFKETVNRNQMHKMSTGNPAY